MIGRRRVLISGLWWMVLAISQAVGQSPWRISAQASPDHLRPGETCRFTLTLASLAASRPEVSYDQPVFPRGLSAARACTQTEELVGSEYRYRLTWELTATDTAAGALTIPAVNFTVLPGQGVGQSLRSSPVTVTVRDTPPPEPPLDSRAGWLLAGLSGCVLVAAVCVLALLRRADRQRPLPGAALPPVDPKSPEGRLLAALRQAAARRNKLGQAAYLAALATATREYAGRAVGRTLLTTAEVREAAAGQRWAEPVLALLEATDSARFARDELDEAVLESLLARLEAALRGV